MIAPLSLEALADVARVLGLEFRRWEHAVPIGVDFDRAQEQPQYALLRGDEFEFEGTARECSAYLIGWCGRDQSVVERRPFRDQRQLMVTNWAKVAFGHEEATSIPQRGVRLLEEAVEAFQACGGDEVMAHKLIKYVFERPPGQIGQELGGVAVTTLALAAAAGLSADEEECREIHRVLSKPIGEFTERNARKNAAGFKVAEVPRHRCPWAGCPSPDECDGTKHLDRSVRGYGGPDD